MCKDDLHTDGVSKIEMLQMISNIVGDFTNRGLRQPDGVGSIMSEIEMVQAIRIRVNDAIRLVCSGETPEKPTRDMRNSVRCGR